MHTDFEGESPAKFNGHETSYRALRVAYAAFNPGDIDAAIANMDPQIEWTEPVEFPGGGTTTGVKAQNNI